MPYARKIDYTVHKLSVKDLPIVFWTLPQFVITDDTVLLFLIKQRFGLFQSENRLVQIEFDRLSFAHKYFIVVIIHV